MKKERLAMIEMLLCALCWSLSGVLTKLTPWNVFAILAGRSIFAGLVIFIYMRAAKLRMIVNKKTMGLALVVVIVFLLYLPAVQLTTAANAIVLQYTAPVYVLILSAIIFKQKVKRADVIAVVITFFGVAFCFVDQIKGGSMAGNLLAMASGVFLAAMFIVGGRVDEEERMSGLFFAQVLAVVIGLPFLFTTKPLITGPIVFYVVLHGVVQLGIAYILYSRASRHCKPLTCSLISVLEPLVNPIWVWLFVGETPSLYSIAGSLIVLVTVTVWCVWGEKQRLKEADAIGENLRTVEQNDGI